MPDVTTTYTTVSRGTYLRLHAYGLFLGLLATASGTSTLLAPERARITVELDRVPPSLLAWSAILVAGGLQLIVGMVWRDMRAELAGLAFIVVSLTWAAVGRSIVFGVVSTDAALSYVVLAIVGGVAAMRASALLSNETLYVVYPGRAVPEEGRTELLLAGSAEPDEEAAP